MGAVEYTAPGLTVSKENENAAESFFINLKE
jgi:hypothetical protein